MSVQKILIKNLKKSDKDFGQIAKMVLFYEQNQEFDENLFDEENITDFYLNIQKDLDTMLKDRNRTNKNRKRKELKNNENKK